MGVETLAYSTKQSVSVDFTLPNYLTIGDQVKMPVTLRNNTNMAMDLKLMISHEPCIEIAGSSRTVHIDANSFVVEAIDLVPLKAKSKSLIRFSMLDEKGDVMDMVKKEIQIESPYFPIQASFSDVTARDMKFHTQDVVEGSIYGGLSVYNNATSQVFSSLETLVMKPYGCFEQTSSVNYANMLVLDYIKEEPNKVILKEKLLDYIRKGYSKMKSFETSDGGFSFWGRGTGDIKLTAYGLLQLSEMNRVWDGVDPKFRERLEQWLWKNWKKHQAKMEKDKELTYWEKKDWVINNAFLAYLLSEAGYKEDDIYTYEASVEEALQSEDPYRVALMAIASYNLGNETNYNHLVKIIESRITGINSSMDAEYTAWYSYGRSKSVVVKSMCAIALMKSVSKPTLKIDYLVNDIIRSRHNRCFGTTRSNLLALKALLRYEELGGGEKLKRWEAKLYVNKQFVPKGFTEMDGMLYLSSLESYLDLSQEQQLLSFQAPKNVPYTFDFSWLSKLPPSAEDQYVKMKTSFAIQ